MTISNLQKTQAEVALGFESWRRRLLTPEALAKLAKNLGLGWFTATDITGLWKIGLLRADLVITDAPLEYAGLIHLEGFSEGSENAYCDFRRLEHRPEGYGSALQEHEKSFMEDSLAFHPFRVFVLHHVERTLKISTSNTQYLLYEPGILNVAKHLQQGAKRWTSSIEFVERFDYWNQIAETAAVAEPMTYEVIFMDRESPSIGSPAENKFERSLREMLVSTGKIALHQMRSDLAFNAETLDENRSVHVLLRLMKGREREKLKGQLGGAMHFLAMAESIRRSAEQAFAESWPEEDEIGPGQWFPGARKMLYGSERVFDAPRRVLRDYLNLLGLDFGVKVRCYVEGDTEFGALAHAAGSFDHVQLVNLSGQIAEKRGKGLAFVESLKADKRAGIFSVVVLDGDRQEYLRMLHKAADEGNFHGRFFISDPDIECGNFSVSELIETAIQECQKIYLGEIDVTVISTVLLAKISNIHNNNDLFDLLKAQDLVHLRKSESWGKALMELAITHPLFPIGDKRAGQKRPIIEAAELLLRIKDVGFFRSLAAERVDSCSGKTAPLKASE